LIRLNGRIEPVELFLLVHRNETSLAFRFSTKSLRAQRAKGFRPTILYCIIFGGVWFSLYGNLTEMSSVKPWQEIEVWHKICRRTEKAQNRPRAPPRRIQHGAI